MDIAIIKKLCEANKLRWTNHIFVRLIQWGISISDVINTIITGEIIENYPDDYPYPSCLILGLTVNNKFPHVVCGLNREELWLITAYYPNKDKWSDDFKRRKEQ